MAHKYDHQTISTVNATRSITPKDGAFVEAGLFVQDTAGGEFERANGTRRILGVVVGLEGTYNQVGVNQSIATHGEEITCQVDGDYSAGDMVFVTAEGKATADSTNAITQFGEFTRSKIQGKNIGFIRRL